MSGRRDSHPPSAGDGALQQFRTPCLADTTLLESRGRRRLLEILIEFLRCPRTLSPCAADEKALIELHHETSMIP